jgi:alkylation response protein AidB-like acyl-CoA dehydrogenase
MTTATATRTADPVARIREIAPVLRLNAAQGEAERAITAEAHEALVAANAYNLMLPKSLGGEEADLLTMVRVIAEAAKADGSAGWCAMISGVYATFGGLLPRAGAEEVFGGARSVVAGTLSPIGAAVKVPGGYRFSGRWPFASNSPHANWFCGGAVVMDGGQPVMLPAGMPQMVLGFFPKSDVTIIDTWQSTGLRGTGSHDYTINDVFVPTERTFWFSEEPREPGPLYSLPVVSAFGTGIGAVPLGIAERMLDELVTLAPNKTPILSPVSMQMKPNIHDRVGIAVATLGAARAYLERVVTDGWAVAAAGKRLSWEERGRFWLGGTHAGRLAMDACDSLYTIAGSSSVYAVSGFDRCLRDCRTAVQHVMTQYVNYEIAGRQALGLPVTDSIWMIDYRGDC